MGGTSKKEYRWLEGVPVLARSVLPFLSLPGVVRLVVTVSAGEIPNVRSLLSSHLPMGLVVLVEGGDTRQESVFRGLGALREMAPEVVLIHDGARPWVDGSLIERVLASTERFGACVPVMEVTEAVKQVGDSGLILRHYERSCLRFAQTPQGFLFPRIMQAHQAARDQGTKCVDDGELYDRYVGPVAWVPGNPANRKITWPWDLDTADGPAAPSSEATYGLPFDSQGKAPPSREES
jgi:2-C-methyl-D-erythritol 4-phosphate cytidylyltransferase